jgi:hypothetical protein
MKKYAYVENVPGLEAEQYEAFFDDGEYINHIAGFDGIDVCMDYVKGLIRDGYSLINLCGDFGKEHVAELMKDAPEGTKVCYAAYLSEEQAKLEALEQYIEYGMIIIGEVEEPARLELSAPVMNTHVVFVKDLEQAVEAARKFAEDGVDGIELCSWFDMERTKAVIAAVEAVSKSIPVGSNGITI